MKNLTLDDQAVRFSCLSHRAFKAAPCQVLLPVTPRNKAEALAKFRRTGEFGSYSGLWISGIADLTFLQDFPDLLYLEVVDQKRVDTRPLECLSNLRGLHIEFPAAGIDFSWFPELEVFVGDWHADNCNLASCQELRTLKLWQFKPESSDLTGLAQVTRLETLEITKTEISSLSGAEAMEDLRFLDIAYAPKLTSLEALSAGNSSLRELNLANAKKVSAYRPLASVRYLRRLKLSTCASMPNLKWTRGMDRLDLFSFVETNVEDGDLSPLLQLPRLRYAGTMDKKHYNYKFEKLNELLQQRFRAGTGSVPGE